jgi:hypothetical protein
MEVVVEKGIALRSTPIYSLANFLVFVNICTPMLRSNAKNTVKRTLSAGIAWISVTTNERGVNVQKRKQASEWQERKDGRRTRRRSSIDWMCCEAAIRKPPESNRVLRVPQTVRLRIEAQPEIRETGKEKTRRNCQHARNISKNPEGALSGYRAAGLSMRLKPGAEPAGLRMGSMPTGGGLA